MNRFLRSVCCLWILGIPSLGRAEATESQQVNYEIQIAPVLKKYCAGCHNDVDREGEFSLESYSSMTKGVEDGPAFLAEDPDSSLIYRLVSGVAEPKMPPADEPAPTDAEVALLRRWIEQGAKGPAGAELDRLSLHVPAISSKTDRRPITAIDWSSGGDATAVARYREVQLSRELSTKNPETGKAIRDWSPAARLDDFPGKVTSVHFCLGGGHLITSSGVVGLGGVATLWEWPLSKKVREFKGHRDIMFDAEVSPDGKLLATASYDRSIIIWNLETGDQLRQLDGHNGAVYDVAFSPDSKSLVSSSADSTCKVWRVSDGERLDTLGQPLKEQYAVCISPDGRFIAAGGADNRIRVWNFVSRTSPQINPLKFARFAHEGPIVKLAYTPDGKHLISLSEDKTIKVWETKTYTETQLIEDQQEVAMALAVSPGSQQFLIGKLDGTIEFFKISPTRSQPAASSEVVVISPKNAAAQQQVEVTEQEPNSTPRDAQSISLPCVIQGSIANAEPGSDADCYRFKAQAGEEWVFEVNAERSRSNLDSLIEVLTVEGQSIPRLRLQAVRDSYFTFRGKTADQSDDFRLFNWEEMELNEYLYANGEVVKLWLYPRGPDSGFNVYPGTGKRWGYFDSTPLAHALGEPCYVVEPHSPQAELIANGLPVFDLFFQNDDESQRMLGKDSKLIFSAPVDGDYVLRIRDVRGMEGENFTYSLTARPRQQDFSVKLVEKTLMLSPDGANEIQFNLTRQDQFEGPVTIHIEGLPVGFASTSPILIEAEQIAAEGVVVAAANAKPFKSADAEQLRIYATAMIDGTLREQQVAGFDEVKINEKPKVQLAIVPASGGALLLNAGGDGPPEFEIEPGETIMLQVQAKRLDHKGEISFGREDAGRNLPHGLYVDNIGLNGLLLLEDQSAREFFVTAAKWVPEQSRLFHLKTGSAGVEATQPVLLHIRRHAHDKNAGAEE